MFTHRVGTFFMMVGFALIVLFVLSDMAGTPVCNLLLIGVILLGLGIFLWFRNPPTVETPSGRFRILKGVRKKQEKK